jgi:hypothetical protein
VQGACQPEKKVKCEFFAEMANEIEGERTFAYYWERGGNGILKD